jgi:hypothetical protein
LPVLDNEVDEDPVPRRREPALFIAGYRDTRNIVYTIMGGKKKKDFSGVG